MPTLPRSKAARGNRTKRVRDNIAKRANERLAAARTGLRECAIAYGADALIRLLDGEPDAPTDAQTRIMDGFVQQHMNALVDQKLIRDELDMLLIALRLSPPRATQQQSVEQDIPVES